MKLLTSICCLQLVAIGAAQAQDAATYIETAEWLKDKINQFGRVSYFEDDAGKESQEITLRFTSMDSCLLKYVGTTRVHRPEQSFVNEFAVTVPLAEVDTVRTVPMSDNAHVSSAANHNNQGNMLVVELRSLGAIITSVSGSSLRSDRWAGMVFGSELIDNKDLTARVSRAFENAIRICKSQAPPKKKEPF